MYIIDAIIFLPDSFLQLHILNCPSGPPIILKGIAAPAFTSRRELPLIRTTKNDIPFYVIISARLYYEKHRGL